MNSNCFPIFEQMCGGEELHANVGVMFEHSYL